MRRSIALALLTFALAGCGGDDEQRIRAALDAADRAWMKQDFERGCALHTRAAQRELSVCEPTDFQAVTAFFAKEPPISEIDVDGDTATVRREDGGDTTRMRRVDGRWLIDEP